MEFIPRPDSYNPGEDGKPGSMQDDFVVPDGVKLKVTYGMIDAMKSKEAIGVK